MSLEEILCRHAKQFLAVNLQKLSRFGVYEFRVPQDLATYIAESAERKVSLAESSKLG